LLEALCERFPTLRSHARPRRRSVSRRSSAPHSHVDAVPRASRYYRECLPLFPMLVRTSISTASTCHQQQPLRPKSALSSRALRTFVLHTPCGTPGPVRRVFRARPPGSVGSALMRRVMRRWPGGPRHVRPSKPVFTNSQHVAGRIRRTIIGTRQWFILRRHQLFHSSDSTDANRRYGAHGSALVPYKRVDIAIEACQQRHAPHDRRRRS